MYHFQFFFSPHSWQHIVLLEVSIKRCRLWGSLHHMWPRVCSVEPSLIQPSKSVSHTVIHPSPPWLLWSPAAFLVMEILHPLSSSLPSPTSFSLCWHSTFTFSPFRSLCCASSLALSVKLIDSEPSLGALCASFFLQKLIRATVSYSRLPLYCKSTNDERRKQIGSVMECFFVRQPDKVSVSDSQYSVTVTEECSGGKRDILALLTGVD